MSQIIEKLIEVNQVFRQVKVLVRLLQCGRPSYGLGLIYDRAMIAPQVGSAWRERFGTRYVVNDRMHVRISTASHLITRMWLDEDDWLCAELQTIDTAAGHVLCDALIGDHEDRILFMLCGDGAVVDRRVQADYRINTIYWEEMMDEVKS